MKREMGIIRSHASQQHCQGLRVPCCKTWLSLFTIALLVTLISMDEDYYALLGVSKEASNKDIRQAFKTLALSVHPEKNPGDPGAPDRFLQVHHAYEVLKDESLRKKYNRYGEKAVGDSHITDEYRDFDFYKNEFGTYDDVPHVLVLDGGDFDAAESSGELWFVNLYIPQCSDCHDLEPMWRDFAKEMDGVIRVGAVNCEDNIGLCSSQGVSTYPTILLLKKGMNTEQYFGDWSKESLTEFAMQSVKSKVTELWHGNVFKEIEGAFAAGIGWLITFCAETGDCLSSSTRWKLAAMLDGLVNVGWMDCSRHAHLCENFEVTSSSTAYFAPSGVPKEKESVLFLRSLDAKEMYNEVMRRLPDLETLTKETFSDKVARHRWLVSFSFGLKDPPFHEFKKLKVLLKENHIQVGKVRCIKEVRLCSSFSIQKPSIAAFKGLGIDKFEIHHGASALYDVSSFAKDSVSAYVTSLQPGRFPSNDTEPWLVVFLTPRSPLCRALLPELRKASIQLFGHVNFGTVDCATHSGLCRQYNVSTYPTTVMLNQSSVHEYEGHYSTRDILEFVEHLAHPAVVTLTPDTFQKLVLQRGPDETWMVDLSVPWCGACQAMLPEWRRMAQMLADIVKVGIVDCQKHLSFCQRENVRTYPEIRLFPQNASHWDQYLSYTSGDKDAQSLRLWALESLPRASEDLTPEDLRNQVFSGRDHWLLSFQTPWCEPCLLFASEFEHLAHVMRGTMRLGTVDCQAHSQVCDRSGVKAFPTVRFYPYLGLRMRDQGGEDINSRDANGIANVLRQKLQQISAELQSRASKVKDEL